MASSVPPSDPMSKTMWTDWEADAYLQVVCMGQVAAALYCKFGL